MDSLESTLPGKSKQDARLRTGILLDAMGSHVNCMAGHPFDQPSGHWVLALSVGGQCWLSSPKSAGCLKERHLNTEVLSDWHWVMASFRGSYSG